MALRSGPNAKLPTVKEICTQFGTNQITLKSALDELETQNIIYRRQGSGIYVSPKLHRKSIMVFLSADFFAPLCISPFWGLLWGWFAQEAQNRSQERDELFTFHLISHTSVQQEPFPDPIMQAIFDQSVDGVLSVGLDIWHYDFLRDQGVPCVAFAGPGDCKVTQDSEGFIERAAIKLAEQGCRKIGIWSPCAPWRNIPHVWNEEFDLSPILAKLGMEYDPALRQNYSQEVFQSGQPTELTHQMQGRNVARRVFGPGGTPRPDGLIVMDDMMTDGALPVLQACGIKAGRDIQIVTHHNAGSPILFGRTEGLLVLEYKPVQIVQQMFALLDRLLEGERPESDTVAVKAEFAANTQ